MKIIITDDIIKELDSKIEYLACLDSCDEYPYEIISIGQKYKNNILNPLIDTVNDTGNVFDDIICHELTYPEMIRFRLSVDDTYYGIYDQEARGVAVQYTQPYLIYRIKSDYVTSYETVRNFKNVIKYFINASKF